MLGISWGLHSTLRERAAPRKRFPPVRPDVEFVDSLKPGSKTRKSGSLEQTMQQGHANPDEPSPVAPNSPILTYFRTQSRQSCFLEPESKGQKHMPCIRALCLNPSVSSPKHRLGRVLHPAGRVGSRPRPLANSQRAQDYPQPYIIFHVVSHYSMFQHITRYIYIYVYMYICCAVD